MSDSKHRGREDQPKMQATNEPEVLNRIIQKAINSFPKAKYDGEFFKSEAGTNDELKRSKQFSKSLAGLIASYNNTLEISSSIPEYMSKIPLIGLQRLAFTASAVWDGRDRYIALSHGLYNALRFVAEHIVIGIILKQKQKIVNMSEKEREIQNRQLNELFHQILYWQMTESNKAVPFLSVHDDMLSDNGTRDFAGWVSVLEALPLIFIYLHEVGHFELRHLGRRRWRLWGYTKIRGETQLLNELTNKSKSEEYEADAFAIQQANEAKRALLATGSGVFFLNLSVIHDLLGYNNSNNTHPHAANRLYALLNRFGESSSSIYDPLKDCLPLIQEMHQRIKGNHIHSVLLQRLLEENNDLRNKKEFAAMLLYNMIVKKILEDVKETPERYKAMLD